MDTSIDCQLFSIDQYGQFLFSSIIPFNVQYLTNRNIFLNTSSTSFAEVSNK